MTAAVYDQREIIQLLVHTFGANLHLTDNNGQTARMLANHPETAALLDALERAYALVVTTHENTN
jgi:hypothetical protein